MAYDQFLAVGATSQMIEVPLRSATTGQLLTGVAYGDVTATYIREGAASETSVSPVTMTQGTWVSGGWIETGIAGVYQFGIPNAALAAGAKAVTLVFSASGAIDVVKRVVLVVEDLRDVLISSRLAPTTAGRTLDVAATGEADVNVTLWAGNAVGDAPATVADLPSEPLDAAGTRTALGMGSANLDTQLADLPTVAEFEARTLPAADYTIVSDLPSVPTTADNATAAAAAILLSPAYKIATTEDHRVQSNVTHWDGDDVGAQDFILPVIVSNLLAINSFDLPSHGISAASGTDLTVTILPTVDPAAYSGWLAYIEYTYWSGDFPLNDTWVAKVVSATATTITLASEIPENLSNLSEGIVYLVPMGSGLTAQETANAALLTPAGVAAAGSQMDYLEDILEDTGTTLQAALAGAGATVTIVSAVDGGDIEVFSGDTWEFTISSSALSLSKYEALGLVVKRTQSQTDNEALLYLRTGASGLQRINGAAPISTANGTLTNTATSFTGKVAMLETAGVTARSNYVWWLKGFDTTPTPDEGFTLATGKFTITPAGLQAIA